MKFKQRKHFKFFKGKFGTITVYNQDKKKKGSGK
jgi:hypothetical protein